MVNEAQGVGVVRSILAGWEAGGRFRVIESRRLAASVNSCAIACRLRAAVNEVRPNPC